MLSAGHIDGKWLDVNLALPGRSDIAPAVDGAGENGLRFVALETREEQNKTQD